MGPGIEWLVRERLGVAMPDYDLTCEETAEVMRKKNRYREMILSGRLVLPPDKASRLLGPDCLYHLYSLAQPEACHARSKKRDSGKRKS